MALILFSVWIEALLLLAALASGCGPSSGSTVAPRVESTKPAPARTALPEGWGPNEPAPTSPALDALAKLPQTAPLTGTPPYNRKDWRHWIDTDGDCQDARQEVLIEESEIPVTFKTAKNCKVASGRWTCPYTGKVFTDPRKLDVDHMVPLVNAHKSGGSNWSAERRKAYANDLENPDHLVAVSASANRSKGARGPEEWMPDENACWYLEAWVGVKVGWDLGVSEAERKALGTNLEVCQPAGR